MELCILSNLSSEQWAAWIQAAGSILALITAFLIAGRQSKMLLNQRNQEKSDQKSAEINRRAELQTNVIRLGFEAISLIKKWQTALEDPLNLDISSFKASVALEVNEWLNRLGIVDLNISHESDGRYIYSIRNQTLESLRKIKYSHENQIHSNIAGQLTTNIRSLSASLQAAQADLDKFIEQNQLRNKSRRRLSRTSRFSFNAEQNQSTN